MWIRAGGGLPMWMIFTFYNIIIKSANMHKGGGKTLIHKMWIKRRFLLNPSLRQVRGANKLRKYKIKMFIYFTDSNLLTIYLSIFSKCYPYTMKNRLWQSLHQPLPVGGRESPAQLVLGTNHLVPP